MGRRLCMEFKGALARHFGDELCVEVDEGQSLRELLIRLAFEHRAPINHEYVLFSVDGEYVDPNTPIGRLGSGRVAVHYVHPGG